MNRVSDNQKILVYYTADASAGIQLPADAQAATDNVPAGWIDFRDVESAMCFYRTIDGASNLTTFRVVSNTTSAGAGTDHAVKTLTTPANIDAVLETCFVEFKAEDITDGDRYITCDLNSAAAQTGVVVFVLNYARRREAGLTTATETTAT